MPDEYRFMSVGGAMRGQAESEGLKGPKRADKPPSGGVLKC